MVELFSMQLPMPSAERSTQLWIMCWAIAPPTREGEDQDTMGEDAVTGAEMRAVAVEVGPVVRTPETIVPALGKASVIDRQHHFMLDDHQIIQQKFQYAGVLDEPLYVIAGS